MSTGVIIAIIAIAIILTLIFGLISIYNKGKRYENNIENSFAQIDTLLLRRADLIPNLVNTIKGAAKHENETLTEVIKYRSMAVNPNASTDEKIEANNQLTGALSKLMRLQEAYPELKVNQNFLGLQKELTDTEDKISHFRQFYNDSVLIFNRFIAMFPTVMFAGMFGFTKKKYLETPQEKRENVTVQF